MKRCKSEEENHDPTLRPIAPLICVIRNSDGAAVCRSEEGTERNMGLKPIRRAIREGRYEFTIHALEEMDEDDLDEADVRQAILHGELSAELTDDPRGIRFVVYGTTQNQGCKIEVVCRFLPSGLLRIITVYKTEE